MKRSKSARYRAQRKKSPYRKNPAFGTVGDPLIHGMLADSAIIAACSGMTLEEKQAVPAVIAIAQATGFLKLAASKMKDAGNDLELLSKPESTESPTT